MGLLTTSDFNSGYHKLSINKYGDLAEYITKFEDRYMCRMLGEELYSLYLADLDPACVPQSSRFLEIFNSFCKEVNNLGWCCYHNYPTRDCCTELLESEGIKEMQKGFVYWEYIINQPNQQSPVGPVKKLGANSEALDNTENAHLARSRWNRAVETFDAIQKYICNNLDVYPEFKGFPLAYKFPGIL